MSSMIKTAWIPLEQLHNNTGQLHGINKNPRDLTKEGFDKVVRSIKDFPEMMEARELVVVLDLDSMNNDEYVVIGGNQRLRALKHLGYREAPCRIVNWSIEQINEFIIKDNLSYGAWDWNLIANEWEEQKLIDWGMDIPITNYDEGRESDIIEHVPIYTITIETENKLHFENVKNQLDKLKIEYREGEK